MVEEAGLVVEVEQWRRFGEGGGGRGGGGFGEGDKIGGERVMVGRWR